MKKIIIILLSYTMLACAILIPPTAKFNVTVVDDEGNPVKRASVNYGFSIYKSKVSDWGTDVESHYVTRLTNDNGFSSESGFFNAPGVAGIDVTKDGYYQSYSGFSKCGEEIKYNKLLNRWEPYPCELKVVLKKKKNPVPMYRKGIHALQFPEKDTFIGYDLEIGDWVHPHGKGKISDFVFDLKNRNDTPFDGEANLTLTFSNELDGIVNYKYSKDNSSFIWPYNAPIDGYQKSLFRFAYAKKGEDDKRNFKFDDFITKYLFRVRTEIDKQGNIISANYGYIDSEITCDQWGYISFTYYFNPDNQSKSLEFNGENLFNKKDKPENNKK